MLRPSAPFPFIDQVRQVPPPAPSNPSRRSGAWLRFPARLASLLALLAFLVSGPAAFAQNTYTVTNTADSGPGSLRSAMSTANSDFGTLDNIAFDPSLNGQTIILSGAALVVSRDGLVINASNLPNGITIRRSTPGRILEVSNGFANPVVTVNRVRFCDASVSGDGGAIKSTDSSLNLTDCTFQDNAASGASGAGGAIHVSGSGSLTLTNCTFFRNTAVDYGALYCASSGGASVSNSTFTGNRAFAATGTGAIGLLGSPAIFAHVTVFENAGGTFGGGLYHTASLTLNRCLLAGNLAVNSSPDLYRNGSAALTAVGNNLIGNNGLGLTGSASATFPAGTLVGTPSAPRDARLRPIGPGGGQTFTLAPLSDSLALNNAGTSPLSADQRGFPRGVGGASDLGAVERGPLVTVTNTNDGGAGSLRAALAAVTAPDTRIQFASGLSGVTITLSSAGLQAPGGTTVEIDGSTLARPLTLNGANSRRIFSTFGAPSLTLQKLILIDGNPSDGLDGGAVFVDRTALLAIDCTFRNSNTTANGGGIAGNGSSRVVLHRCTIARNTAPNGGGLVVKDSAEMLLSNCTVSGNRSTTVGGGTGGILVTNSGRIDLVHTTMADNVGNVGGLYAEGTSAVRVERSVLARNQDATAASDLVKAGGTFTAVGPSLVGNNGLGNGGNVATEFPAGTLVGTPAARLDPRLAPLNPAGGITLTQALLAGSPALDAAGTSPLGTDQRGFARGINGASDLGAFERGPVTIIASLADSGAGTLRQALLDAAGSGGNVTVVFDPALNGATLALTSGELAVSSGSVTLDASQLSRGLTLRGTGSARLFSLSGLGTSLVASRVRFIGGWTSDNGGALFLVGASAALADCAFEDNAAGSTGGAIFLSTGGDLALTGCTFHRNEAGDAGALYFGGTGSAFLTNCTITGSRAGGFAATGAIVFDSGTSASLTHVTVFENSGGGFGGGIYSGGRLNLNRCLLAGNIAPSNSPDLYVLSAALLTTGGAPTLLGNNGLGLAGSVASVFPAGALVGTPSAPLNPRLRPFGPGGGLTGTLAPQNGSPALDAAGVSPLATDQRGFPRGVGSASDLGAVERGPLVTVTTSADTGTGSLRAALAAVTAPDTRLRFATATTGTMLTLTSGPLQPPAGATVEIDGDTSDGPITLSAGGQSRHLLVSGPASVSLHRLILTAGSDGGNGGGSARVTNADFLAVDCTLTANIATLYGGALLFDGIVTRAVLQRCTLAGNTASDVGAAVVFGQSELRLTNCTVSGNRGTAASSTGGIGFTGTSRVELTHTTVTANVGTGATGGLTIGGNATLRLERSILAGNFDSGATPDLYRDAGTIVAVGPNLLGSHGAGTGNVSAQFPAGPLVGTNASPLDPKLSPLFRTGGPTAARAPLAGSPALDAAGLATAGTDQRGFPRAVGSASDLGAVERGPLLTVVNAANSGTGSLRAVLAAATAPDTRIGFDPALDGQTIPLSSPLVLSAPQSVSIDASSFASGVLLDGQQVSPLIFQVPTGATLSVAYLGLTRAVNNSPGGAVLNAGTFSAYSSIIFSNTASQGGGVFATAGTAELVGCRVEGNGAFTSATQLGRSGTGAVTATDCWFGTNAPPANSFSSGVVFTPYLTFGLSSSASVVPYQTTAVISARIARNTDGTLPPRANLRVLANNALSFSGAINGTLSAAATFLPASGVATATFTGTYAGSGSVSATFLGVTATVPLTVTAPAPIAGTLTVATSQGFSLDISFAAILAQATDANGLTPLEFASVNNTTTQGGSVSYVGNGLRYFPPSPQFTGTDLITYAIRNSAGGIDNGQITVQVLAPAYPPGLFGLVKSGNQATVTFKGAVPGLSYALEFNPTLTGAWQPLTPSAVADANGNFVFIDPGAVGPKRFYRARAQP